MPVRPTPDHLQRRLRALLLGASDMWDVWQTARYLLGEHDDGPQHHADLPERVRRVLEAGLIVTYSRPFVDARRGLPRLKIAPALTAELRESHDEILRRRHAVYAHTDETRLRRIIELDDLTSAERWTGNPDIVLHEEWQYPADGALRDMITLARLHLDRFEAEHNDVRHRLAACTAARA